MKRMSAIRKGIVAMIIFSAVMGIVMAGSGNEQPVAKATFFPQGCIACECKAITLDGSGSSDLDGQIVDYKWYYNSNLIGAGKIVSLGKEFCDNPGTYRIKLIVTDNGGAADDYEFGFIVKTNPPPIIKEITYTDEEFFVLGDNITVTAVLDEGNYGKLNYTWYYNSDIFQKNGDGERAVFRVIASKVFKNNYKISVVVSNACGEESQRKEIDLEVRSLQLSSSLKTEIIIPPEIYEGKRFMAESSYVPEPGDKIVYLWNLSKVFKNKEVLIKQSRDEKPSFTLDDSEIYRISLEITNRYGAKGSASRDFGVINKVNDNPVANASATRRQVLRGEEIILNGSLSWDDGEIESYCWLDKSYGEDLGCSGNNPILKVAFNRSGWHEIVLTITDNGLPKKNENDFPRYLSDTDAVMINVIKSSSSVVPQVPASVSTQETSTPTPTKIYVPLKPQPPPPKKESNKIPGAGIEMAIAVIITAIVFRRRGKK